MDVKSCFQKVRLRIHKKLSCNKFRKRKHAIKNKNRNMKSKAEAELVEEDSEYNLTRLKFNLNQLNDKSHGKQNNIWKIKNKFFPKIKSTIPTAKRNLANQIISL